MLAKKVEFVDHLIHSGLGYVVANEIRATFHALFFHLYACLMMQQFHNNIVILQDTT